MEQLNKYRDQLNKYLQKKNAFTDVLEKVETTTKVSRVNLVLGLAVTVLLYLIFGYGGHFLANFIGFIYPAYCSIKAIESIEKDDDTKWLTYWVVYAAFSLVESVTDIFLSWIPLYALLKCIFLVYLMIPTKWNGSIYIYHNIIKPHVLKHQGQIDNIMNQGAKGISEIYEKVNESGEDMVRRTVADQLNPDSKTD